MKCEHCKAEISEGLETCPYCCHVFSTGEANPNQNGSALPFFASGDKAEDASAMHTEKEDIETDKDVENPDQTSLGQISISQIPKDEYPFDESALFLPPGERAAFEKPGLTPFSACIRRPLRDPEAFKKILIGIALCFIPFLGSVVFMGYAIEYLRGTMRGNHRLPVWEDWRPILRSGVHFFIASCVLWVISSLLGVVILTPFAGNLPPINPESYLNNPLGIIDLYRLLLAPMLICSLLVALLISLLPLCMLMYARKSNLAEYLNLRGAFTLVTDNFKDFNYIVLMLTAFLLAAFVLIIVTFIIPPVSAAISVLATLMTISVMGEFYRRGKKNQYTSLDAAETGK